MEKNKDYFSRKMAIKANDLKRAKEWIKDNSSIDDLITIKPNEEKIKAETFSGMKDVQISPDVEKFWDMQAKAFNDIYTGDNGINHLRNEYSNEYERYQDIFYQRIDRQDEYNEEKQKKSNIERKIETNIKKQNVRTSFISAKNEVGPLEYFASRIKLIDNGEKSEKIINAEQAIIDTNDAIKDKEIYERKKRERIHELEAKEEASMRKMKEILSKISGKREEARLNNENSVAKAKILNEQYEQIKKYKSLVQLKNQITQNKAGYDNLKRNNPDLYEKLENIPDNLPDNTFIVTLNGPLQIKDISQKISNLTDKLDEIKNKLSDKGISAENPTDSLNILQNDDISIEDIQKRMEELEQSGDKNNQEYNLLQIKKEHMENLQRVKSNKEDYINLGKSINNIEETELYKDKESKIISEAINDKVEKEINKEVSAFQTAKKLIIDYKKENSKKELSNEDIRNIIENYKKEKNINRDLSENEINQLTNAFKTIEGKIEEYKKDNKELSNDEVKNIIGTDEYIKSLEEKFSKQFDKSEVKDKLEAAKYEAKNELFKRMNTMKHEMELNNDKLKNDGFNAIIQNLKDLQTLSLNKSELDNILNINNYINNNDVYNKLVEEVQINNPNIQVYNDIMNIRKALELKVNTLIDNKIKQQQQQQAYTHTT